MNIISDKLLFRFLRYIVQGVIIYLLFRYLPVIKMDAPYALIITLSILLLCIIFEQCLIYFKKSGSGDLFDILNKPCDSCNLEKFDNNSTKGKKCRIVCDDENNNDEKKNDNEKFNSNEKNKKNDNETNNDEDKNNDDDTLYRGSRYNNGFGFGGMFYDEYPFYNGFGGISDEIKEDYREREREEKERIEKRRKEIKERAHSLKPFDNAYQEGGEKSERAKAHEGRGVQSQRAIKGTLDDELPYTDYNHLPVGAGYRSHAYEYGYSFLPPEKWYPQPPRPPICVTNKRCSVQPFYTQGTPVDVKEWHSSRRITPPDLISTDNVNEKLNSGR